MQKNNATIPPVLGYVRFVSAWARAGLHASNLPSESEWEFFLEGDFHHDFIPPSPRELVEIFPESEIIIKRNLSSYKKNHVEQTIIRSDILDEVFLLIYANPKIPLSDIRHENGSVTAGRDTEIQRAKNYFFDKPLARIEHHIKRLSHLKSLFEWKGKKVSDKTITEEHIEAARKFPLTEIVRPNRAGFVLCPFHSERTPSCKIFKDNKFRCFGCEANGDTIDWIMKTENLQFIPAVKKILGK